jgi:hypothetical protein
MQSGELAWQIITIFLLTIALALTMYFLEQRNQSYFLWCAFVPWVCAGAAIALYLNTHLMIEHDVSGWLRNRVDPTILRQIP